MHSPRLATLLSAVVPGSGQIYNRKYWKAPVVIGLIGFTGYKMLEMNDRFRENKKVMAAIYNDSIPMFFMAYESGQWVNYNTEELILDRMERYRKSRDLFAIGFLVSYILNVIDAAVDAHFFTYDVSDDLSFEVVPISRQAALGFTARLSFK